jgi:hypothetical protein
MTVSLMFLPFIASGTIYQARNNFANEIYGSEEHDAIFQYR